MKRCKLLLSSKNPPSLIAFLSKAAYLDRLQTRWLTPALRDGADLESSVTGAEAPAYYQGVPPDFAKASSGRPGRCSACRNAKRTPLHSGMKFSRLMVIAWNRRPTFANQEIEIHTLICL